MIRLCSNMMNVTSKGKQKVKLSCKNKEPQEPTKVSYPESEQRITDPKEQVTETEVEERQTANDKIENFHIDKAKIQAVKDNSTEDRRI